jgi:hypothetical protein
MGRGALAAALIAALLASCGPGPASTGDISAPSIAELIGAPDAITIATVEAAASGDWLLVLRVVRPNDRDATRAFALAVPGGWRLPERARVRVTADGWAAVELDAVGDLPVNDSAVVTVSLLGDGRMSPAILGSAPVWLPDETLLLTAKAQVGGANGPFREVARRVPDHGLGAPVDLVIDDRHASPWFPRAYVASDDLDGLVAWRDDGGHRTPVTLHWDGAVTGRDPALAPYLELGVERRAGARSEETVGCAMNACTPEWRRADGTRLPLPPLRIRAGAWSPDGTSHLVLEDAALKALADDGGEALTVRLIAVAPAAALQGDVVWIAGMNDWAVIIEGDDGTVTVVPADGSGPARTFEGTLAGVRP